MDLAIVTGANDTIGYKISQKLVELGFKVYGLAHNFDGCHFAHRDFIRVECDVTSSEALKNAYDTIANEQGNIFLLVHAAQRTNTNSFEATGIEEIEYTLKTGLLGPMILTRLALPSLMKYHGYIINLAWNGQGSLPTSSAGAATQGGLHFFGKALFEELQDTGVKVCNLYPQKNTASDAIASQQSTIDPDLVADAVEQVLQFKENNCIHELILRPMGTREEPKIPTAIAPLILGPREIILPTREKFPVEPEPIPTPEAKVPEDAVYFDDEDDDEEDELDQLLEASRQSLIEQKQRLENKPKGERSERGGRNRRNRRRGRDRDRSERSQESEARSQKTTSSQAKSDISKPDAKSEDTAPKQDQKDGESRNNRNRRNRNRRNNRGRKNPSDSGRHENNPDSPQLVDSPTQSKDSPEQRERPARKQDPSHKTGHHQAENEVKSTPNNSSAQESAQPTERSPEKRKTAKKKAAKKRAVEKKDSEPKPKTKKAAKKRGAKKKVAKKKDEADS